MKAMPIPHFGDRVFVYKLTVEDVDAVQAAYRKIRAITEAIEQVLSSPDHRLPSDMPGAFTYPRWHRPLEYFSHKIADYVSFLGDWLPCTPRQITAKDYRKDFSPFGRTFEFYYPARDIIQLSG